MLVQVQNSMGDWNARELETLTWCGNPVELSPEQLVTLESGQPVRFAADWYANVRLPRTPRPAVVAPEPRFTCRVCGSHRDTTISGHCDDCE